MVAVIAVSFVGFLCALLLVLFMCNRNSDQVVTLREWIDQNPDAELLYLKTGGLQDFYSEESRNSSCGVNPLSGERKEGSDRIHVRVDRS
jgi:hypothetical protein